MAAAKKKSTAKTAAPKKAAAKKSATKKPAAKKSAAKKSATKKAGTKKAAAKKPATKKAAAKKPATKKPAAKKTAAKPSSTKKAATQAAPKKSAAKKATAKKPAPTPGTATTQQRPATKKKAASKRQPSARTPRSSARKATTPTTMSPSTTHTDQSVVTELPKPRFNKDGFGYTKDFDLSFVKDMHDALQEERVRLTGQAKRLEDEAHQLVEEAEMGDVQFDDEGGEGDTMVVERERDLALSAQAREAVTEIDDALGRVMAGTYGYSLVSGRPIPRERLEAIPWSTELVEEKVGGIGR